MTETPLFLNLVPSRGRLDGGMELGERDRMVQLEPELRRIRSGSVQVGCLGQKTMLDLLLDLDFVPPKENVKSTTKCPS